MTPPFVVFVFVAGRADD